jgi:hypothetical protein
MLDSLRYDEAVLTWPSLFQLLLLDGCDIQVMPLCSIALLLKVGEFLMPAHVPLFAVQLPELAQVDQLANVQAYSQLRTHNMNNARLCLVLCVYERHLQRLS